MMVTMSRLHRDFQRAIFTFTHAYTVKEQNNYFMVKEAFGHMHETMQSSRGQTDRIKCAHMEEERRCTRPREVLRNNSAESIL